MTYLVNGVPWCHIFSLLWMFLKFNNDSRCNFSIRLGLLSRKHRIGGLNMPSKEVLFWSWNGSGWNAQGRPTKIISLESVLFVKDENFLCYFYPLHLRFEFNSTLVFEISKVACFNFEVCIWFLVGFWSLENIALRWQKIPFYFIFCFTKALKLSNVVIILNLVGIQRWYESQSI